MDIESFLADLGLEGYGLIIAQVFVIVFLTLVVNFFALRLLARIIAKVRGSSTFWDDALVLAARKPLSLLIWLLGISWAAELIGSWSESALFESIGQIREVAIIILLTWFVVSFISRVQEGLTDSEKREEPLDQTTAEALGKLLRASVIITSALVLLQTLGFSISGVLAFGGIGGIAIGFAAKDLLANFFGGLMIYTDRPFSVGDWIMSPDQEIEGVVEKIGWRVTTIRAFDKRPLYVPNSTFTTITVKNPSRMTHRRINETIGLRYDDIGKMAEVVAEVKAMLQSHEEIDSDQVILVNFDSYNASSLDFFIWAYTRTVNWIKYHEVKQDVLLKVADIIDRHGAEIAFPTRTLHLSSLPGGNLSELELDTAQTPIESTANGSESSGAPR